MFALESHMCCLLLAASLSLRLRYYPPGFGWKVAEWVKELPVAPPSPINLMAVDDSADGVEVFYNSAGKADLGDLWEDVGPPSVHATRTNNHTNPLLPGCRASSWAVLLQLGCCLGSSEAGMWPVVQYLAWSRTLQVKGKAWRRLLVDIGLWPVPSKQG